MTQARLSLSPALIACALLVVLAACTVNIGGTQERRLVELSDGTMERRQQAAQEYVTDQQLASLRGSAQRQFPSLTESDLASLKLSWQRLKLGDGDHVMVVVTFMPRSTSVDAKAVADYVAAQVLTATKLRR